MSSQSEKKARAEAMLGELAELGLRVAKDLAVRLHACEDAAEAVALAEAFQKTSRVVRLTLALDFKLDRDTAREARAAEQASLEVAKAQAKIQPEIAAPTPTVVEARQDRVRSLLNRLIWNESEGDTDDYDVLLDDLSARLDEAALSPDFETLPIETLARRMIADMGLAGGLTLSLSEPAPPERPDG